MLFGPRSPEMSQCPSVVLIDILNTFPDIVLLSEQVASFIFMFKLLNVSNYSFLVWMYFPDNFQVGMPSYTRNLLQYP
jgi:hypothetical protein